MSILLFADCSRSLLNSHQGEVSKSGWASCSLPEATVLRRFVKGLVLSSGSTEVLVLDKGVAEALGTTVAGVTIRQAFHFRFFFNKAEEVVKATVAALGQSVSWGLQVLRDEHKLVRVTC